MKISFFNNILPSFKGRREDRNTVSQLSDNSNYALTENNKLKITNAIKNLAKESNEKNIQFLLGVANNNKYVTNIKNGKEPNSDWTAQLKDATEKALANTNPIIKDKYATTFNKVFNTPKDLSEDEKSILNSQKYILSKIDKNQLEEQKNTNIKNFERNMQYFITSSETPLKQKKYILDRMSYLLSDEYKINPQIKDKKTQVAAELMNDIVVNTKESIVPNTKAINQKHHGMCVAISTSRKMMSYEDKANYVDTVLSELDDKPYIMVYDKTRLGENKKVPVEKANVDYKDALNKGYRIVDASVTNWMNIADMYDANSVSKLHYIPFDRKNFGAMTDSHFIRTMDDPELAPKHEFYQSLMKAKEAINSARDSKKKEAQKVIDRKENYNNNLKTIQKNNSLIKTYVQNIIPGISNEKSQEISSKLINLLQETSADIDNIKDNTKNFHYIHNEESIMKENKIKDFIKSQTNTTVNEELLNKRASDLQDLISNTNAVQKEINPISKPSAEVANARKMFEAEAAYRFETVYGLKDPDYLTNSLIQYGLPDSETMLSENLQKIAKHVKETKDPIYLEHFANVFSTDKNRVPAILEAISYTYDNDYKTTAFDKIYSQLGMGDRKLALASEISSYRNQIESGDKDTLKLTASTLDKKVDKKAITEQLKEYEKILTDNPSEEDYTNIFNKFGKKSQFSEIINNFNLVKNAVENPEAEESKPILESFKIANGMAEDASGDEITEAFNKVTEPINDLAQKIANISASLDVYDKNGQLINTANPEKVVLKKMEKAGELIPEKDMEILQQRFDALDKIRSQDEFSSRQGKISDPALYKLSDGEKASVAKIEKSINKMYSNNRKDLDYIYHEIKEPLEEFERQVGVESGRHFVSEGSSGLDSDQCTKIAQQLTDRQFHTTTDKEKAIDVIKNGPHSGMTASSVYHNEIGGHEQYVAEISPNETGKDVLYHDNSWGGSEQENTWIDSKGVKHTDYSDNRGGETGYITNDKYRNGNYVDDLMYKTGYIPKKNGQEESRFSILMDFNVPGEDGETKRIAQSIQETIFNADTEYLKGFNNILSGMTKSEIKENIERIDNRAKNWESVLKNMNEKIFGSTINKSISTRSEYDALAKDDPIKLAFEKTAFVRSFPDGANWTDLAKISSTDELKSFEDIRNKKARMFFNYAFDKNANVFKSFLSPDGKNGAVKIIEDATKNHSIKLSKKEMTKIVEDLATLSKDDAKHFDGSLKNSIDLMVNKTLAKFDKIIPESADSKLAKAEIKENMTKEMKEFLYFNINDMKNTSTKFKALSKYIDNKYNPQTDEEFVEIYNKLQDMTTQNFLKETADVKKEDLGIKNYDGYEMLRRYKGSDTKTTDTFENIVFQKEVIKDIKEPQKLARYRYSRLYMHHQGDIYKDSNNFDDLYLTFKSSINNLNTEKLYNKYKDTWHRKSDVIPAFPKVQVLDESELSEKLGVLSNAINNITTTVKAQKDLLNTYKNVDTIKDIFANTQNEKGLSNEDTQFIKSFASEFITRNYSDKSLKAAVDSAKKLQGLKEGTTCDEYKQAFEAIDTKISKLRNTAPAEKLQNSIKNNIDAMNEAINRLIKDNIQNRYQAKVKSEVSKVISSLIKGEENGVNAQETFFNDFEKYHLLHKPDEVFEKYLLSMAKDSPIHSKDKVVAKKALAEINTNLGHLSKILEASTLVTMQDLLMQSVETGNAAAVGKAFNKLDSTLIDKVTKLRINLGNEKSVATMVRSLLYGDEDFTTAKMFVNKLGLAEKFISAENNSFDIKAEMRKMNTISNSVNTVKAQIKIVNDEVTAILKDKDFETDFATKIDSAKQNIIEKTKKMTKQADIKTYLEALDNAKAKIEKDANASKAKTVSKSIVAVEQNLAKQSNNDIAEFNATCERYSIISKFIKSLNIPEYSDAMPLKKAFEEKLAKFVECQSKNIMKMA